MADSNLVWAIVAAILILVILLAVGYLIIQRMRHRRNALALELDTSRELVEDRAFNQLRLARTEADVLASRGVDVSRPQGLLGEAEAARNRRDFEGALQLARAAHESLVRLRNAPLSTTPAAVPPAAPPRSTGSPPVWAGEPTEDAVTSEPPASPASLRVGTPSDAPRGRLPKNKVEAQFQLHLLEEELPRANQEKGPNAMVVEATALQRQAQENFDRGEFTEALRLALKARRRLGTKLETLPLGSGVATVPAPVPEPGELYRCTSCGETLRPSDRFCRYCGTLRGPARCPTCGTAAEPDDKFCNACGGALPGGPA